MMAHAGLIAIANMPERATEHGDLAPGSYGHSLAVNSRHESVRLPVKR